MIWSTKIPSVFCKSGDYLGCHPQHKCNSGLRQRQIGGAKQVNKKSRYGPAMRVQFNKYKFLMKGWLFKKRKFLLKVKVYRE